MAKCFVKRWSIVFFFFSCALVEAQENFSLYNEPEISVEVETNSQWSYDFGVAHRRVIYAKEAYVFVAKNIELSQFTYYKIGKYSKIGLGLEYKFTELFSETAHDKFLIMQQFNYGKKYNALKIAHRFRVEERFQEKFSLRPRYRLSVGTSLGQDKKAVSGYSLTAMTETLLILSKYNAPRIDQRFGISVGKGVSKNVAIELGLEYQYEDYAQNPEVDVFIRSGISISL